MSWLRMTVLAFVAVSVGCGGLTETEVEAPEVTAKESVRAALEYIAESGAGGSELGAALENIAELRKTDPEIADEIEKELTALMEGASSDQIQKKAKELIEKLDGKSGS